jgi:hypothetical protein
MDDKPGQEVRHTHRKRVDRNILIGLAVSFSLLTAAVIVWPTLQSALQWYVGPLEELSVNDRKDLVQGLASAVQALAVFLTGSAALVGLLFTWRNLRQTRENTEKRKQIIFVRGEPSK